MHHVNITDTACTFLVTARYIIPTKQSYTTNVFIIHYQLLRPKTFSPPGKVFLSALGISGKLYKKRAGCSTLLTSFQRFQLHVALYTCGTQRCRCVPFPTLSAWFIREEEKGQRGVIASSGIGRIHHGDP